MSEPKELITAVMTNMPTHSTPLWKHMGRPIDRYSRMILPSKRKEAASGRSRG